MKFYPSEKAGGGVGGMESFSHAVKGGYTKFWGSFYVVA